MKSLLTKLSFRRALGLYIDDREVVVSLIAPGPRGPIEVSQQRVSYAADELPAVLKKLLDELVGSKRARVPVAIGAPAARFFFGTRPTRTGGETSPEAILQKAFQSPTICIDDLIVDLLKSEVNKVPLATFAACRKKYLAGIMAALSSSGVRPFRLEPAPCALVRLAETKFPAARRAKLVLRLFLGETEGLAVLASKTLAIAWRRFELRPGMEAQGMVSAVRTLKTLSGHYGIELRPEFAIFHGRGDLQALLQDGTFAGEIGTRVVWYAEPALDGPSIAFGLAVGCLKQNLPGFDLAKTLKPPATIREIFPWSELAIQSSLVILMGLMLSVHSANLQSAFATARAANRRHPCLNSTAPEKLEKEKKDLQQKVDVVRRFLESRILWTSYMNDIPGRLPENVVLNTFHGVSEMEYFGKKSDASITPKRYFLLRGTAPVASDGATPREIDRFLQSLRDHPLLKRDFPNVDLADIKRFQLFNGAAPMANFTIMCLPNAKPAPAAASGEGGGAEKEQK